MTARKGWDEPSIGFLLNDVARMMRKRLEQRARAEGVALTRAQWQTLAYLARNEGINQTTLAQMLDIEPITLVRLLDRLEAQGVVERRIDPKDRRQRILFLTDLAEPELDRIRTLGRAVREETLAGLDPNEQEQLLTLLARMKTNLQARLCVSGEDQERKRRHG